MDTQTKFRVSYLTGEDCPICGSPMKLMTPEGKITVKWAFHMESTHGIPHELLPQIMKEAEGRFITG